jgi:hypothetical protein
LHCFDHLFLKPSLAANIQTSKKTTFTHSLNFDFCFGILKAVTTQKDKRPCLGPSNITLQQKIIDGPCPHLAIFLSKHNKLSLA